MKHSTTSSSRKEYAVKNVESSYDSKNDLLYVCRKKSSVYSNVVVGDFHIEFSKEGVVVGVEVLRASELLKEYGISKKVLENISDVSFKVVVQGNSLLVFLIITALNEQKTATITMNNIDPLMMNAAGEA